MTAGEPHRRHAGSRAGTGVAYSAGAYAIWAMFPVYFKAVAQVPAMQVLAHRVIWSLLFLGIVIAIRGGYSTVSQAMLSPRIRRLLALSSVAIAVNWGVFVWAVTAGRILECSLGYFVTPLLSIVLGVVVLRERLRPAQWLAVTLAAMGVSYQVIVFGAVPWVALVLALSFAGYGLLRKLTPIEPIGGLFIEALLLTPLAFGYLLVQAANNSGAFLAGNWRLDALLAFGGPLTALPLILFVAGVRRNRLATVGLLQYITPTGQFLLAVFVYGEAFSRSSLVVFASIWAGLLLYSLDTLWRSAKR